MTTQDFPHKLFLEEIRTKETKVKYVRTLKIILCQILDEFLEGNSREPGGFNC